LKERYGDDPSTHPNFDPDLWLKVGLSSRLDRNRVYGFSNTTTENLRTTRNVSTIESSQSLLSIQSPKFTVLLDQGVQKCMTVLNEKYERLSTYYKELRRIVMDIRSQMSGTCMCTPLFFLIFFMFNRFFLKLHFLITD